MLEARGLTFAGLQDFLGSANVADANILALPLCETELALETS